jgi:hypothetical protein
VLHSIAISTSSTYLMSAEGRTALCETALPPLLLSCAHLYHPGLAPHPANSQSASVHLDPHVLIYGGRGGS